ncbi:hypothetical protein [Rosistilla oblonga]|uniref:hypothetical protein n=1 Tax=Rosistilla oblonga TaxID=2527990 RepID=UPI003A97C8DE
MSMFRSRKRTAGGLMFGVQRILCWLVLPATIGWGQADLQQIADARSYIESINDRAEAITRYDAAARRETMMLFPDGRLLEERSVERVMFDAEGNRYLWIARKSQNLKRAYEAKDPAADVPLTTQYLAILYVNGQRYELDGGKVSRRMRKSDKSSSFPGEGNVDFRKLGIGGSVSENEILLKLLASANSGDVIAKGDRVEVQLATPEVTPYSDKPFTELQWRFDAKTTTVRSFQRIYHAFWRDKLYPSIQARARFQWQRIDEHDVPRTVLVENRFYLTHGPENLTGEVEPSYAPTTIDCHWFSLNQPLPDQPFSVDYLSDEKNLHAFVDPELNGAIRLMDR